MTTRPIDDDAVPPMPDLFDKNGVWVGLTEAESMLLTEFQFQVYENVHRSCLTCEAAERKLREATTELHRLVAEQRATETQMLGIRQPTRIDLVRQMIADRFV
jgi:hypothetical protein